MIRHFGLRVWPENFAGFRNERLFDHVRPGASESGDPETQLGPEERWKVHLFLNGRHTPFWGSLLRLPPSTEHRLGHGATCWPCQSLSSGLCEAGILQTPHTASGSPVGAERFVHTLQDINTNIKDSQREFYHKKKYE